MRLENTNRNLLDMTGEKFSRLTVLRRVENSRSGKVRWLCRCECGEEKSVWGSDLRSGNTSSCGCLNREKLVARSIKHGMSRSRFYGIWAGMKNRCSNPNLLAYANYGGRGITVCNRWMGSFDNFRDDLYVAYLAHVDEHGERNTTIERKDVNGHYEPNNVIWATYEEQSRNVRRITNAKGASQRDNGTWRAQIMKNGRNYTKTLPTKEQALAWRSQKLAELYNDAAQ